MPAPVGLAAPLRKQASPSAGGPGGASPTAGAGAAIPGSRGSCASNVPLGDSPATAAGPSAESSPAAVAAMGLGAEPWGVARGKGQTAAFTSLAQDANEAFRPYMEDGHYIADSFLQAGRRGSEESWGYFAVYDGHGGRESVDYCESKLHDLVLNELRACVSGPADVKKVLVDSFKKVDNQLAMLGAWNNGCTATVSLLHRRGSALTLHVGNVGDSRAVLVGPTSCRRLTVDHRAGDPEETRRVVADGGVVRHGRVGGSLSVSRSLGDHHLKDVGVSCVPDVCTLAIDPVEAAGSAMIIASDGLWDAFEDEDAAKLLRECIASAAATGGAEATMSELRESTARTLVQRAKEKGSRDNILALVVFL